MGELNTKFYRKDIETLIEAMSDWEALGNQEYSLLQMIKGAPMPPEDHEAFEYMQHIKDHFRRRERDIVDSKNRRQETAVFLKAKLMLVRQDLDVNEVFEMTAQPLSVPPLSPAPVERVPGETSELSDISDESVQIPVKSADPSQKRLELAEFFIKDLGVWEHYQNFLAERASGGSDPEA